MLHDFVNGASTALSGWSIRWFEGSWLLVLFMISIVILLSSIEWPLTTFCIFLPWQEMPYSIPASAMGDTGGVTNFGTWGVALGKVSLRACGQPETDVLRWCPLWILLVYKCDWGRGRCYKTRCTFQLLTASNSCLFKFSTKYLWPMTCYNPDMNSYEFICESCFYSENTNWITKSLWYYCTWKKKHTLCCLHFAQSRATALQPCIGHSQINVCGVEPTCYLQGETMVTNIRETAWWLKSSKKCLLNMAN